MKKVRIMSRMALDESREEASTLKEDLNAIADFICSDNEKFTLKIMQGVQNRSLENMD